MGSAMARVAPPGPGRCWRALTGSLLTLVLLLVLVACGRVGAIADREHLTALNDSLRYYTVALRWGHMHDVLAFHARSDGSRPAEVPTGHEDFTVTRALLMQVLVDEEQREAVVEIRVECVNDATATVKSRTFRHIWWWDKQSKRWFNGSDFPAFWLAQSTDSTERAAPSQPATGSDRRPR